MEGHGAAPPNIIIFARRFRWLSGYTKPPYMYQYESYTFTWSYS